MSLINIIPRVGIGRANCGFKDLAVMGLRPPESEITLSLISVIPA